MAGLKGAKKKPAMAEKPGTEPKGEPQAVLKRPAAATSTKKVASKVAPGASNIDMKDIFAKLRARKGRVSRNCFTSIAYHGARVKAESSGYNADQAKAIAREFSAKASVMFDKD